MDTGTSRLAGDYIPREPRAVRAVQLAAQAARARGNCSVRRGELASCPRCGKPLRGSDLVVSGRCPHCDRDLTSLLLPSRFGSLVTTEYLALLGALGVLAGLGLRASTERAG